MKIWSTTAFGDAELWAEEIEREGIIIEDAYFDEEGQWYCEGRINGVGFSGVAPKPLEDGFGRFDWSTERPMSLLPDTKMKLIQALHDRYMETEPHFMMEMERIG
jgi:hypothetical protein